MVDSYESGGILKAISTSKGEEYSSSSGILSDLFTSAHVDDTAYSSIEDLKNEYINKVDNIISKEALADTEKVSAKHIPLEGLKKKQKKQKKQKDSPERLERTLFVGNVSIDATKKELLKIFKKFGEIESVRFRSFTASDVKIPKKVAAIKKQFHSECKSMNAYVVYKDKECVGKALVCNGANLKGLHLRVDKSTPEKRHNNRTSVFVGNLAFNISEEAVREHFQQCGAIEDIRLIRDKVSGLGKGFGYVRFNSSDGAVFGLKLNGSSLSGRAIRVCPSENRIRNQNGKSKQDQFRGLKSTSKKEREMGKKFMSSGKSRLSNAMRRIKNKSAAQKKHSSWNKKEKNLKGKMTRKKK